MLLKRNFFNYYYFSSCNSIFIVCFCILYLFPKTWLANSEIYNFQEYFIAFLYTFCSHFSLIILCFLIVNALSLPSILIKNYFRLFIQAALTSVLLCGLIIDAYVFHVDGVHLTDFFSFNISTLFINDLSPLYSVSRIRGVIIIWSIFCFIEYKIACKIEKSNWFISNNFGKKFSLIFSITLLCSQTVYFFTNQNCKLFYFAKHLPFQYKNNLFLQNACPEITKLIQSKLKNINYPLTPLATFKVSKPKNIVIIATDAWRADHFNASYSPNLWNFAQQGTIFENHLSAANATRHGLFGLFYGIPTSHWYNFAKQQQSPVFIDRLQQLDYQLGIFISTQVKRDQLDKAIFSKVNNLRFTSIGDTPAELDKNTTDDWIQWYNSRDKSKPFFSFIFYYSVHEHDFPESYTDKYLPTGGKIKYSNLAKMQGEIGIKVSYKIAVHYMDSLANKVLSTLKNADDLANTIVIITSDHGHQLNDNKQNIWGHGSNFTEHQLKVPFAIIGSEFNTNSTVSSLTTHYDLIATLVPNFLGVTNDIADYSIGRNLLVNNNNQRWNIASTCLETMANSMLAFGLFNNNKCLKIFPSGKYQLISNKNKIIPEAIESDYDYILEAINKMTKFLK